MRELILHTLTHTIIDTLQSVPILFIVYVLIELLQRKLKPEQLARGRNSLWAPAAGALAGSVPQCGFSAAYATLYNSGVVGAGTLIAVFIATSDEAIPILLSRAQDFGIILALVLCKIFFAMLVGYLLQYTVFRHERLQPDQDLVCHSEHCHEHHTKSLLVNSLIHTLKISAFIGVTLLVINFLVELVGEQRLEAVLLSQNIFQPFITALIGLIPGCATSVLLVELMLNGSISFASAIAGLSTGAGFGFIILFKDGKNLKKNLLILLCTYLSGSLIGMVLQLIPAARL